MQLSWNYSFRMLVTYVGLFLLWMVFPSRSVFLLSGSFVVAGLWWGMKRASQAGYFVNRVDVRLHALVILDVALETISFELFRLFQPLAVMESFHRNTNFLGCATAFALLIGCYRYFALRRQLTTATPSAAITQT